jgi:uncharacterized protein
MKTTSTLIAALALGVAACTGSAPASAQSFNCNYARTADEILICQSPELARMDTTLSDAYFDLRNFLNRREAASLQNDQRDWLRARMSCGRNYQCVYQTYAGRWYQLMVRFDKACRARGLNCEDAGSGGNGSIEMSGPLS